MDPIPRRYPLPPHLDIAKIIQEAQIRWLRPSEICEILRNYERFQLTPDPPFRPAGGSLFLFNRKTLRYFRKDGHTWRKKKDGKTIREAHEKLKCGSIDVLHCYYAHGENNESFQRRCYWLLEGNLEHIVLVHYRDVKIVSIPSISHVLHTDQNRLIANIQTDHSTLTQSNNTNSNSFVSQPSTPGYEEESILIGAPSANLPSGFNFTSLCEDDNLCDYGVSANHFSFQDLILSSEQQEQQQNTVVVPQGNNQEIQPFVKSEWPNFVMQETGEISFEIDKGEKMHAFSNVIQPVFIGDSDRRDQMRKEMMVNDTNQSPTEIQKAEKENNRDLKRLDSFGRWMNKEIGIDCDDSLMATASESCNYWNAPDETQTSDTKEEVMSHLESEVGPSVSQEQLFSIIDFSPDWAYSNTETKVLISGKFLGVFDPRKVKWGCMFGKTEVLAEVLTSSLSGGAIRCVAPPVAKPGRVPFYITRSDRLACSEIREFEFHAVSVPVPQPLKIDPQEEFQLQVRLAKLLSAQKWPVCSVPTCGKCEIKRSLSQTWGNLLQDESLMAVDHNYTTTTNNNNRRDGLIERLMKDRLCEWLGCKLHKDEQQVRTENSLDSEGQGVIHLVAALGYDWALGPVIASGVSPSFRDARGWTGLHWAAFYGREETVVTLVKVGADPAALEDPTSKVPNGRTAADVASSRGFKGIAGFLAEAHLTSHLSSLTIKEDGCSTEIPSSLSTEDDDGLLLEERVVGDDVSLKGSLEALRNSAQAASRIRGAFRVYSFRQRRAKEREMREKEVREKDDGEALLEDVVLVSASSNRLKVNAQFGGEPSHYSAALKIQRKYRGWKGRKDFLKIRDKIVKIQAHVRGHQVRKQYKKVVWSVSIVEKAILRWRRKGAGLRGFRAGNLTTGTGTSTGTGGHERAPSDEYDYLSLGRRQKEVGLDKALARVRSMTRSSDARDQYMRLLLSSHKSKLGDCGRSSLVEMAEIEK
ncbi:hypothetical protein LUZ60_014142 [Juncus effusus]|nr:hypothetical protein LUZ60_014142 [Juncus effusus]